MNAVDVVETLLEPQTMTLDQLFRSDEAESPEPWIIVMFGKRDLQIPLPVEERDPATLLSTQKKPIPRCIGHAKSSAHKDHVAHYRVNPGPPLLVSGNEILDGNHRAVAAYIEGRKVKVLDVDNLPE